MKYADRIVSTSEQITGMLSRRLPASKEKFLTITNGYDEEDVFPIQRDSWQTQRFVVVYTGNAAGRQTAGCFFRAIRKLLDEQRVMQEDVEIRFIGIPPPAQLVKELRLQTIVKVLGYMEHKELIHHFTEATILLLVVTTLRGGHAVPGKVFEYMATGRPLLALVLPDSAVSDIVRKASAGVIVPPDNTEEIANALEQYYREWKRSGRVYTSPDWSFIEQFERRHIAEQFARSFDFLLSKSKLEK